MSARVNLCARTGRYVPLCGVIVAVATSNYALENGDLVCLLLEETPWRTELRLGGKLPLEQGGDDPHLVSQIPRTITHAELLKGRLIPEVGQETFHERGQRHGEGARLQCC